MKVRVQINPLTHKKNLQHVYTGVMMHHACLHFQLIVYSDIQCRKSSPFLFHVSVQFTFRNQGNTKETKPLIMFR